MTMTRIRNVLLAVLLLGVIAACGSSSSSAPSGGASTATAPGSGSSGPQTVTIKGFAFHPSSLTVKPGTKVTFINEDSVVHTASSTGSKTINSGDLKKGQSYTVTFRKPGTYAYICDIHQYMKGTVTVS